MTAASSAVLVAVVGLSSVLAVQRRANTALATINAHLDQANYSLAVKNDELDRAIAIADLRESNRRKDAANAALSEANGRAQARFELACNAIRSFKSGVEQGETRKNDSLKPLRSASSCSAWLASSPISSARCSKARPTQSRRLCLLNRTWSRAS